MARAVYLLGGGGHGRVVLDALLSSNITVDGIFDSQLTIGDKIFDVPILGGDELLDQIDPIEAVLVNGLGSNPDTTQRKNLFKTMKLKGFDFMAIRHPSSFICQECELGEGSQVMLGAALQNRVKLGKNVVVNTRASVDHDCVIGADGFISPGAILCGDVRVEEAAFIGAGAIILPGSEIGRNAIVAAGAVVTKHVFSKWVVAGNPAVQIGMNA